MTTQMWLRRMAGTGSHKSWTLCRRQAFNPVKRSTTCSDSAPPLRYSAFAGIRMPRHGRTGRAARL